MSLLMVLIRAFLVWLVIIAAETVHGILRGVLLVPIVGDLPARQVGMQGWANRQDGRQQAAALRLLTRTRCACGAAVAAELSSLRAARAGGRARRGR